ncbi:MAG: GGDEF domain-containing protein [Gallionella sp.]|nr:GGDEF domain-containing protein [Gallionella sp.]MDP1594937.1 GGDEF domain-containing protein [Gallionella sp.]MDP1940705.1 GGDEF domain-containing protein [Gallionella sp.]
MIYLLSAAMVLIGLLVHVATLVPLRKMMGMLPAGTLRNRWRVMMGLILIFIAGYLGYIVMFWGQQSDWSELLIPGIFLFGSLFVRMTIRLSLQTAADLRRMDLLEAENITDPLTKVCNRRYLDRRLEDEVARSKRYAHDLSVLMLDIDHFKRVNDTYGHQAGDVTLATLCSLVKDSLRDSDVIARYGGEEFVVICTNTAVGGATLVAERIRQLVESQTISIADDSGASKTISITVSIGVSGLSGSVDSKDALVNAADKALYCAKEEGRNRVVVATEPVLAVAGRGDR